MFEKKEHFDFISVLFFWHKGGEGMERLKAKKHLGVEVEANVPDEINKACEYIKTETGWKPSLSSFVRRAIDIQLSNVRKLVAGDD